jgi:hypothetical protein
MLLALGCHGTRTSADGFDVVLKLIEMISVFPRPIKGQAGMQLFLEQI